MTDRNGSAWPFVHAFLLVAVLAAAATMTCSNDRLERRLIALEKAVARGGGGTGSAAGGGPRTPEAAARTPGASSGVVVEGWGGRRAEVTYVEGAPPGAPLTLAQKPRPQADVYVNRRGSPPKSLNHVTSNEGETTTQTDLILHRMIGIAGDPTRPEPWLAKGWDVADDRLTYTFHLRRGIQFADGRPFTSKDVVFTWDVTLNPSVKAEHLRGGIEEIESVTAPDDFTVVVKRKIPYWAGLYDLGFGMKVLHRAWYEEEIPKFAKKFGVARFSTDPKSPDFGETFNKIRIPCPGTGPYCYPADRDYTNETKRIVLVQNPFWYGIQLYGDRYNLLRYETIFIADDVVADEEFRKGNFDVQVVEAERWEAQLSKDPRVAELAKHFVYDHMRNGYSFIAWNCRKPPFDDARVRRAMTHLVDREWIVREIQRGRGGVATCLTKTIYPSHSDDIVPWPFDPAAARRLLEEAGWRDTDGDGVVDRDGKPLEFELKVPSGRPFFLRVGDMMREAAKQAGVRMRVSALEWSVFIQDYYDRKFDGVSLLNSHASPWIDPYDSCHSSQDVPQGGNSPGWRSREADALLESMRVEFDDARRNAIFHRFNHLFHAEQPLTLLTWTQVDVLCAKRFEDVQVYGNGLQWFAWWVKPENVKYR